MSATNIHFEMAERSRALNYGGIGAMHLMGQKLGLAEEIDARVQLLKRHLPYHESDHVLNLAYNSLLDGVRPLKRTIPSLIRWGLRRDSVAIS